MSKYAEAEKSSYVFIAAYSSKCAATWYTNKALLANHFSENWFFDRSAAVDASQGSYVVSIILGIMSLLINWATMFNSCPSFPCAFCNIISLKIYPWCFLSTIFLHNEISLFVRHSLTLIDCVMYEMCIPCLLHHQIFCTAFQSSDEIVQKAS